MRFEGRRSRTKNLLSPLKVHRILWDPKGIVGTRPPPTPVGVCPLNSFAHLSRGLQCGVGWGHTVPAARPTEDWSAGQNKSATGRRGRREAGGAAVPSGRQGQSSPGRAPHFEAPGNGTA